MSRGLVDWMQVKFSFSSHLEIYPLIKTSEEVKAFLTSDMKIDLFLN